uniref:Myosin IXa-like 1 n=1 Tax=Nothobranchius kuhntae TaxID=321403 RepID=A0A1A8HQX1_NOTKU
MRNKNYKSKPVLPKHLLNVKSLKYLSNLTLHDRITKSLLHLHKKKKPPSISAQFQASLNKLMETLGQSEPYFVKCIRSNADKLPLRFDDDLVLRQLRYTGMLETVRIRQSGYNVKYNFKDFCSAAEAQLRYSRPGRTAQHTNGPAARGVKHGLRGIAVMAGSTTRTTEDGGSRVTASTDRAEVRDLAEPWELSLEEVLKSYEQPINEEQAWAVCYQCCSGLRVPRPPPGRASRVKDPSAILLHRDGTVSLREEPRRDDFSDGPPLPPIAERQLVQSLGVAIYRALDWGLDDSEERELSPMLEHLIERMASEDSGEEGTSTTGNGTADEGYSGQEEEEEEEPDQIMGLDLSTWEDRSYQQRERSLHTLSSHRPDEKEDKEEEDEHSRATESSSRAETEFNISVPTSTTVVQERMRTVDELNQKTTRAKRENRRLRELEQAQFSLELLKVRANSGGASSPSEERRWSLELVGPTSPPVHSSLGTPDSQSSKGSFELLTMDEEPPRAPEEVMDSDDLLSPVSPITSFSDSNIEVVPSGPKSTEPDRTRPSDTVPRASQSPTKVDLSAPQHPPKMDNYLPTFYVPAHEDSTAVSHHQAEEPQRNKTGATTTTAILKPFKERRESARRPVVVVISMQKETPIGEELCSNIRPPAEVRDSAAHTGNLVPSSQESAPVPVNQVPVSQADQAVLEKLVRLNEKKEERQRSQHQQNEKEMMEQIRKQKEALEQQRLFFVQYEKEMFEKQRGEALERIQQSRQGGQDLTRTASSVKTPRPSSLSIERTTQQVPHSRTQSDSTPPPLHSPPAEDSSGHLPQLPPPPSSAPTERRKDRPATEGWAPKLVLESRAGAGTREKTTSKKAASQPGSSVGTKDKPGSIFFSPHDKEMFTSFNDAAIKERAAVAPRAGPVLAEKPSKGAKAREVGRVGQKKKARMARTRSDFLTRAPSLSAGGDSDEDDYDGDSLASPRHFTLPLAKQNSTEAGLRESCFSDSDMPASSEAQKKLHKAMSSGDLGKVDSMRKNSQDGRVRGKMRFWGKSKYGDKKSSREKLICGSDSLDGYYGDTGPLLGEAGQENMSPPCSPDSIPDRGIRDPKESKELSPKVKRRRSVKISSVTLEPTQWQNDSLQILTSLGDYRSMNDFLIKKINDLDTEDSKKDTMVDVVFKKALKEFRLNIFNFYSTALAMDDGKCIRYKDLYALFEQILEKTMRQEQRDWRESPVTVWVNTFKVFLDEFRTEYKSLDNLSKQVPKPERKKRRNKDADIVEEHNGHIFKSTQYNIPTYCEYCSSLIWMMDRACVCKLCRYACHRKCCQKTTTKCSKKFDPELSSRQFGVEVSRLTTEERTVPLVVEKLINYIEMHGLYTEGIYRKPGAANKIKELKLALDTDVENMNLDDYNIHVIASVFKQWLRDLPSPLMTFELYEEFIRAMGLQDQKEKIRGVYSVIDQLSRTHLNTLERLIFHLVRISLQEETNRMSANALAIVFAPCILRCPDTTDPLQSVQDISKTTACVELVICEQMSKYKVRLKDINTLEFAENKAKSKLTLIRRSMGKGQVRRLNFQTPSPPVSPRLPPMVDEVREENGGEKGAASLTDISEHQQAAMQQEERVLTQQIESLQKEKEELTFEMLALEPRASDDETLESEASIGTADSSENLNVDSEETISDFSERGPGMTSQWPFRSDGKSHRRRTHYPQPDNVDSVDSCSTVSSYSSSSHFHPSSSSSTSAASRRLRFQSKTHGQSQAQSVNTPQSPRSDSFDSSPTGEQEGPFDERPQFTSRGTYNPEKGKQKLKGAKPSTGRHTRDGGDLSGDPPDLPQHLVLYGNNEFMCLGSSVLSTERSYTEQQDREKGMLEYGEGRFASGNVADLESWRGVNEKRPSGVTEVPVDLSSE